MAPIKVIGIDPGRSTGFAVYDPKLDILTDLLTLNFWGAIEKIDELNAKGPIAVVVEVPKTKAVWHRNAKTEKGQAKTATDVGGVIREGELIAEYLIRHQIDMLTQHPYGKIDADMFKRITGWKGSSNQHTRDAAMMCFRLKIRGVR